MFTQCYIDQRIILAKVLRCFGVAFVDHASWIPQIDPENIKFLWKGSNTTKRASDPQNSETKSKSRPK